MRTTIKHRDGSSARSIGGLRALVATIVSCLAGAAQAAENATGFYLLGSRLPGAGFTPPPGVYFQNDLYFYSGSAAADIDLPFGNNIAVGLDAEAIIEMPTFLWMTHANILGGGLGFSVTPPIGAQQINATVNALATEDSVFTFGDPVVGTFLGWNAGEFHWVTGVLVNVPIGDYDPDRLANISFHRWAADVYGSLTWLDPMTGWQVDNSLGFTFNGENPDTEYRTGTEFHWEGDIVKNFTERFSAGVAGYYYQQITGDSGPGATVGDFKGRVAAIGAIASYNFHVGEVPVTARLKYFHEFDVKNRLQADAGFVTVTFPLSVGQ